MTTMMNMTISDPDYFDDAPAAASPAAEPPVPDSSTANAPATVELAAPTKKGRKKLTPAKLLAELDRRQASIDEARAGARKSLNKRATHLKIQLGGLLFSIAAAAAGKGENSPWNQAKNVIDLASKYGVKTERVTADLERWIRDQTEIAAIKAAAEAKKANARTKRVLPA